MKWKGQFGGKSRTRKRNDGESKELKDLGLKEHRGCEPMEYMISDEIL